MTWHPQRNNENSRTLPPPKTNLMSKIAAIFTAAAVVFAATGCKEKSEAEKQEEEREKLRETKRENAIKLYKTLAEKFPDDPRAKEALDKAKALEAGRPKK